MMLISRVRRNGRVDFVLVLDDLSIERIKRYDRAQVFYHALPAEFSQRRPESIAVAYATAAELKQIEEISVTDPDWKDKALKLLSRSFEFRPDLGDHDLGVVVLGKPTEGPKA